MTDTGRMALGASYGNTPQSVDAYEAVADSVRMQILETPTGRLCGRCGLVTAERWRAGCARCGDLVVKVTSHEQVADIMERGWYDGWTPGKPERSQKLASKRQNHRRRPLV